MKKLIITTFLAIGFFAYMSAQDSVQVYETKSKWDAKRAKYTKALMIVPQYAVEHGLRLDLEFRTGNNALVIAPIFYVDNTGNSIGMSQDYNEMVGGGLDLAYKINLIDANKLFVPYGAIALSYDFFNINTDGVTDNYDYYYGEYTYFEGTKDLAIHKMGLDVLMGFQLTPLPRFVIDVSAGVGGKYSIAPEESEFVKAEYSKDITSIAFTGISPAFNFKIGIKI